MANLNNIPNFKAYKTGIHVTLDQNEILQVWVSGSHYAYNLYLKTQIGLLNTMHKQYPDKNQRQKLKAKDKRPYYLSSYSFRKTFNHYIKPYLNLSWMQNIPAHTLRYGFDTCEIGFKRYAKQLGGFPHFKGGQSNRSLYFDSVTIENHRIKIPKLGWLSLEELGYLPQSKWLKTHHYHITGVWLHEKAGHWYVSVRTNESSPRSYETVNPKLQLGIDVGIKDFAILSNDKTYANITKGKYYWHLKKHLRRVQRKMSRKVIHKKPHQRRVVTMNYRKARLHFQRVNHRIHSFMENWIQQRTSEIIKMKPHNITLEDLSLQGMKHNHKLAPSLQKLPLGRFADVLTWKCKKSGIELRKVSRWYPSSQICSKCGNRNTKQFKHQYSDLQIRTFHCPSCGFVIDRDKNAAINLKQMQTYEIITNRQMDISDQVLTTIKNGVAVTE